MYNHICIYIHVHRMYIDLMYIHKMYMAYILCILSLLSEMNIHTMYICIGHPMYNHKCIYIPVYFMYVHDKYMIFFSHYRHSMYIHRISNVCWERPHLAKKKVLFHQDNAPVHTS